MLCLGSDENVHIIIVIALRINLEPVAKRSIAKVTISIQHLYCPMTDLIFALSLQPHIHQLLPNQLVEMGSGLARGEPFRRKRGKGELHKIFKLYFRPVTSKILNIAFLHFPLKLKSKSYNKK